MLWTKLKSLPPYISGLILIRSWIAPEMVGNKGVNLIQKEPIRKLKVSSRYSSGTSPFSKWALILWICISFPFSLSSVISNSSNFAINSGMSHLKFTSVGFLSSSSMLYSKASNFYRALSVSNLSYLWFLARFLLSLVKSSRFCDTFIPLKSVWLKQRRVTISEGFFFRRSKADF